MQANIESAAIAAHTGYLLERARRYTRNDADASDLLQDTCLHALEALARMQSPPENMRAWLLTVMRNHWFNVVRHRRVQVGARAELAAHDGFDASLVEQRVFFEQFVRVWRRLSAQAQSIAVECLLNGESQEDVSRRIGMTAGGVASSIHRTREQLRTAMFGR